MVAKSKSPTHIIWYVRQIESKKNDLWTRVGAAWEHKSGKGFNMTLDFVPTVPGKYVILEKKEQPTGEIADHEV